MVTHMKTCQLPVFTLLVETPNRSRQVEMALFLASRADGQQSYTLVGLVGC